MNYGSDKKIKSHLMVWWMLYIHNDDNDNIEMTRDGRAVEEKEWRRMNLDWERRRELSS